MEQLNYIGIDCGLDGAFAWLDHAGNLRALFEMPTVKAGKGREYDLQKIDEMINSFSSYAEARVVIENPGKHAPSASGLYSMTACFFAIKMSLVAQNIRYLEVSAQKWQKEFWSKPKMPKGQEFDTKAASLIEAKKLWPTETWLRTERSRKEFDGFTDAALIAEYGRRLGF